MSNGKIQYKINQPPMIRTGRVQMGIQRTIQTEKFQSLVMSINIDEEVQWETLEEWFQKQRNWESILIRRYKEMHDGILGELGHSEKRAFIKDSRAEKSAAATAQGLAQLDDLETLE